MKKRKENGESPAGKELTAGAKLLKQLREKPYTNDRVEQSFVIIRGPRIVAPPEKQKEEDHGKE